MLRGYGESANEDEDDSESDYETLSARQGKYMYMPAHRVTVKHVGLSAVCGLGGCGSRFIHVHMY